MEQAEKEGEINLEEQKAIRKYLLGALSNEAEMRKIEEKILLDDDFIEKLTVAEDQLIDEYLDGTLPDSEHESFKQLFLNIPERKQKLRLIRDLRKYAANSDIQTIKQFPKEKVGWLRLRNLPLFRLSTRSVLPIAAGFAVIIIAFGFIYLYLSSSKNDLIITSLNQAYRLERPLESRITDFEYAPFNATRGGSEANEKIDITERNRAEINALDETIKNPTAENLHSLGRLYLAKRDFDQAIKELEKAKNLAPQDAEILSDLGTAYLNKAEMLANITDGKSFELRNIALKNFEKALEISPKLLAARFNKALSYQSLDLLDQAKKAWQEYLQFDTDSQWAKEARRNLEKLEELQSSAKTSEQILQDFFEAYDRDAEERIWQIISQTKEMNTGIMVVPQLTQQFLAADLAGQIDETNRILAAINFVGELEKKKSGDLYFSDLARYYASTNSQKREILRQAQTELKAGYASYGTAFTEAIIHFSRAADLFQQAEDVWEAKVANFWLANCNFRAAKLEESSRQLLELEEYCRNNKYKWLQVQTLVVLTNNFFDRNEHSKAIKSSELCLKMAIEIDDTYNQQKNLQSQAYIYRVLENYQLALERIEQSFKVKNTYFASKRQLWRNYITSAEILYKLKNFESAVLYGQEALSLSTNTLKPPGFRYDSRRFLSNIYIEMQNYAEALNLIEAGFQEIQDSEKESDKVILSRLYILQKAHLLRLADKYQEAISLYKNFIQTYSQGDFADLKVNNYEAHKGLLLSYIALGLKAEIAQELPTVIELFEDNRAKILEEKNRNTFFDSEQNIYDLAIEHAFSSGDTHLAFEYSEKSKARSLLDLMSGGAALQDDNTESEIKFSKVTTVKSVAQIQNDLPENMQVMQYAVLPDKVLIWIVSRSQILTAEKKILSGEVNEKISSYLNLITGNQAGNRELMREQARELYDILISPALPQLDINKEICLVPDKSLYRLSFASLISPSTNRYLIEDFTLMSAPSTNVFLLSTEAAQRKAVKKDEKLLGIGNPNFNRREYIDLSDLPTAENEVKEISKFYPGNSKIFLGRNANKTALLQEITESNIFHFAGHYIANEQSPMNSKFLLAHNNQNNENSDLEVKEIFGQNLSSIKLAILSACQTGTEGYFKGEGMYGVARSFLAQGVPVVVASQWAVDSDATAELMIKFHRYRRQQKISTAGALRQAQLDLLHDTRRQLDAPYFWAGFLPVGGKADY